MVQRASTRRRRRGSPSQVSAEQSHPPAASETCGRATYGRTCQPQTPAERAVSGSNTLKAATNAHNSRLEQRRSAPSDTIESADQWLRNANGI